MRARSRRSCARPTARSGPPTRSASCRRARALSPSASARVVSPRDDRSFLRRKNVRERRNAASLPRSRACAQAQAATGHSPLYVAASGGHLDAVRGAPFPLVVVARAEALSRAKSSASSFPFLLLLLLVLVLLLFSSSRNKARLLVARGCDCVVGPVAPQPGGVRTPAEVAAARGHAELAAFLQWAVDATAAEGA